MPSEIPPDLDALLHVGDTLILQVKRVKDSDTRCRARVIGWESRGFILLEVSQTETAVQFLRRGVGCVVRFVSDGRACGFQTVVLEPRRLGENPCFQLQWPHSFETVQVRRFERLTTNLPCTIKGESGQAEGEVCDLSASGCRVFCDQNYPSKTVLKLSFALPDGTEIPSALAEIRNVAPAHGGFMLGCAFFEEDSYLRGELSFYIAATVGRMRTNAPRAKTVLLIAADESPCKNAIDGLNREGYPTTLAKGIVDGLGRLRVSLPDFLMVQTDTSPVSGIEICSLVRATPHYNSLPIYLFGPGVTEATARAAGAVGHFASLAPLDLILQTLRAYDEDKAEELAPQSA